MATKIFAVPSADKVVILDTRKALVYPFTATNWADLRLGFFLSITKTATDDDTTGLAETLTTTTAADRMFVGFKTDSDSLPNASEFFGISNMKVADPFTSPSIVADDSSGGWTYKGASNICIYGRAGITEFNNGTSGSLPVFTQDPALTGGRAVLVLLRMLRNAGQNRINRLQSVSIVEGGTRIVTGDVFTNAPTTALARANFNSATFGDEATAKIFTTVPTAFFAYWPFNNSRLRIHGITLEKFG